MSLVSEVKRLAQAIGADIKALMATKADKTALGTSAGKDIGVDKGRVLLAEDITKALYSPVQTHGALIKTSDSLNDKLPGYVYYINEKPIGAEVLGWGIFWTELPHGSAKKVQVFKSVTDVQGHYIRQETGRNTLEYHPWVKYAFHGEDYTAASVSTGGDSYKRKWVKYTRKLTTGLNTITIPYGNAELVNFNIKALVVVDGKTETIYANGLWDEWRLCVYDDRASKSLIITKEASVTNLDNANVLIYMELDVL